MIGMDRPIDAMDRYVDDVMSGSIVVGQFVRMAVERHVKDLARQQTDGFQCHFDRAKADAAIDAYPTIFRLTGDRWAGQPYTLTPFQAFVIGELFGWRWEDGRRRFRKVYLSMARKQGKSTLAAATAHLLAGFDGVQQAQVYLTATKIDQAKVVFDEALRMCHFSEVLNAVTDPRKKEILIPKTDSYIKPLGSDRPFSGLSPNAVFRDELHEWKERHRPFMETMATGFASRAQPLEFTITTAGDAKSIIWKSEEKYAKDVLSGITVNEQYLAVIASTDPDDDVLDEKNWPKSMPNLGVTCRVEDFRALAEEAKHRPDKLHEWKRYYANIEVTSNEQAIDPAEWDACQVKELSNWDDADAVAGAFDAGGRTDLAASGLVARFPDGIGVDGQQEWRYEIRSRCYMDADTSRDMTQQPWAGWIRSNFLTLTSSVFAQAREDLMEDLYRYNGRQVGFDPWNTQQMAEEFQAEGFEAMRISQNRSSLHEPLQLFLHLIRKRKITHDGSQPIFRWALGNLVINERGQRWMPDRKTSADKIDPVVAVVMALRIASLAKSRPRGALFLT